MMTFRVREERKAATTWAIGLFFCTALGLGAMPSLAEAQQDAAAPLLLNFTRPAIGEVVQGPLPGPRTPGFNIVLNFTGGLTPSQQAVFAVAEAAWEGRITGYTGTISVASLTISAGATAIDGVGGVLGSAGPTNVSIQSGLLLPTVGSMNFDSADIDALEIGGTLGAVIEHEMGHVLGIGTLWSCNPHPNTANGCGVGAGGGTPLYTPGSGEFVGAAATARWVSEFSQAGTPDVELGGGAGTAGGHWNEVDNGAGLTGITDGSANDMRDELMTGWLNSPVFVSEMTLASLFDNGYATNPTTPVSLESFSVE